MRFFSKGHNIEFETAVVNEPSVFEPLKFYLHGASKGKNTLPTERHSTSKGGSTLLAKMHGDSKWGAIILF